VPAERRQHRPGEVRRKGVHALLLSDVLRPAHLRDDAFQAAPRHHAPVKVPVEPGLRALRVAGGVAAVPGRHQDASPPVPPRAPDPRAEPAGQPARAGVAALLAGVRADGQHLRVVPEPLRPPGHVLQHVVGNEQVLLSQHQEVHVRVVAEDHRAGLHGIN
jgi:hypothetical protein